MGQSIDPCSGGVHGEDKPQTASRLRGRIESILDWARVRSYRDGENPARWRGHLDHLLTRPSRAQRAKREVDQRGFVFAGRKPGRGLSSAAMWKLLQQDMSYGKTATPHGFRSSFRDWVAERTNFPNEVAEMALAHVVSDKVEAAYRRG